MAIDHAVKHVRIQTTPLNPGDSEPDTFEDQFEEAIAEQTVSGTVDWHLIQVIEGNVSAVYSDFYLIFEK
jgi:hypothetical protein